MIINLCPQYYNVWLSLCGFLMCVAIMLLISWVMSLITFAIFFTLYLIVHYRDPGKIQLTIQLRRRKAEVKEVMCDDYQLAIGLM